MKQTITRSLLHLAASLMMLGQGADTRLLAASFDAAPFAVLPSGNSGDLTPVPAMEREKSAPAPAEGAAAAGRLARDHGLVWEDPREIHQVVVHFKDSAPAAGTARLEYWGSWWPERHLPKDRQPGGGDMGWMELGNWWKSNWRVADAEASVVGKTMVFTFRPVNRKEFPKLKDYPASYRYTLKLRVNSDAPLPAVERMEAFTDSTLEARAVRLSWERPPSDQLSFEVFNGRLEAVEKSGPREVRLRLQVAANPDPNTFDRTLVTVKNGAEVFTFAVDDLRQGPLYVPHFGAAVLPDQDARTYAALAAEQKAGGVKTLYDRIAGMPERTWSAAW
ncbi:MAG: hypothetical protein NTW03_17720, partial [Verrucomicrobia bacterium]|nr:hypothetical protein [Verrucomicrobiota bacterium]